MSSNHAGVFNLTLESNLLGVTARIASEDIKMEDLLQAKYEKKPSLALFGGKVKVNFELFLFQINKKSVFFALLQIHCVDVVLSGSTPKRFLSPCYTSWTIASVLIYYFTRPLLICFLHTHSLTHDVTIAMLFVFLTVHHKHEKSEKVVILASRVSALISSIYKVYMN